MSPISFQSPVLTSTSLPVPGLAEKRPSVLVGRVDICFLLNTDKSSLLVSGDIILVQKLGVGNDRWFEGHVHFVQDIKVGLQFHRSFPRPTPGQKYLVRFKFNRVSVRRQHKALNATYASERVLFPSVSHTRTLPCPSSQQISLITPFNPQLATNPPQMLAITAVRNRPPGSPPFVIFGPYVSYLFQLLLGSRTSFLAPGQERR
jgi:helicase MOV-10